MASPRHFEDFVAGGGQADLFAKAEALAAYLRERSEAYLEGLGPQLLEATGPRVTMRLGDGQPRQMIMLGSNSYLNLTNHPDVVAAAKAACDRYGYGMGAVPLYSGTTDLHRQLEERIAALYGTEDAMIFPCGYSANVGVLSALCGPGDAVLNDASNHASIFDGCRLSGADIRIYLHRNVEHLERCLKRLPETQRGRLIATDGVFSMDGDLAPLAEIAALADRYRARIMVDDAHGLGVVGPTGRGTPEACGCQRRVDIMVGTLSKTPGAVGGYCAGRADLVRYLRYYARTYFFSTSLPAPVDAGLNEVFRLLAEDRAGRDRLWRNVLRLRDGLQALGFDTGQTGSAIVPIIVGDEERLGRFHADLMGHGVYTNLVTYPAVRRKECRLRLCVMAALTPADIDEALGVLAALGRAHGIIHPEGHADHAG